MKKLVFLANIVLLYSYAMEKQPPLLKVLSKSRPCIIHEDSQYKTHGNNQLYCALINGRISTIEKFIGKTDFFVPDEQGEIPLIFCLNHAPRMARFVLKRCCTLTNSVAMSYALYKVVVSGRDDIAYMMIDQGIEPRFKDRELKTVWQGIKPKNRYEKDIVHNFLKKWSAKNNVAMQKVRRKYYEFAPQCTNCFNNIEDEHNYEISTDHCLHFICKSCKSKADYAQQCPECEFQRIKK